MSLIAGAVRLFDPPGCGTDQQIVIPEVRWARPLMRQEILERSLIEHRK